MSRRFNVAIVGATGLVGKTLISILEERQFPIEHLYLLASQRSVGKTIRFANKERPVMALEGFHFNDIDIVWFCAGRVIAADYAPIAKEAGCLVIDNSSEFRYQDDIPLVIPEVNAHVLNGISRSAIIANPNCSTIQMLVALKPIYDAVGIQRINVATYQSVSGSGEKAIKELLIQNQETVKGHHLKTEIYPKVIAGNVLAMIDTLQKNGYTREEMKMLWETQKIFEDKNILVNATAVRVPVSFGHSEAVHIETRNKINKADAEALLRKAPGVCLLENDLLNPKEHGEGTDDVYVSRVREDISHPFGLNLWVVADNIRKGAALNAVQIAEYLHGRISGKKKID